MAGDSWFSQEQQAILVFPRNDWRFQISQDQKEIPGLIVTKPEAAIYFIIDFRNIAPKSFNAVEFIDYCARSGKVKIKNKFYTLLLSPMSGFYNSQKNGIYQMRVAMVDKPDRMKRAPILLSKLYKDYINNTKQIFLLYVISYCNILKYNFKLIVL